MEPAIALTSPNSFERSALLDRFFSKIEPNLTLDRSLVSFQANRNVPFYGWFKYKEGFSANLVESLVSKLNQEKGVLLDPFAGAGTALFASRSVGWDSIGVEVLPVGPFVMKARRAAESMQPKSLKKILEMLPSRGWEDYYDAKFAFRHIPITEGAFPPSTERGIAGYRAFVKKSVRNPLVRLLLDFACFSILESVSYTRKDGQYLRWDHRAKKERAGTKFDKGQILSFDQAIKRKLHDMFEDISGNPQQPLKLISGEAHVLTLGKMHLRIGSCLRELLSLGRESVDTVFTSPPYCNRYDYTRTYALELVYLGFDDERVKSLRQQMLSCTVENRSKLEELRSSYGKRSREEDFSTVVKTFEQQRALKEVLDILETQASRKQLNNANIPRLVKNYFFEMCFVINELARVLRAGGKILMVNDNVRYGGEEIPVDLILSDFAEHFGLRVKHIWTLGRGKGNSSQQMGLHGRTELRKCVYVWEKI